MIINRELKKHRIVFFFKSSYLLGLVSLTLVMYKTGLKKVIHPSIGIYQHFPEQKVKFMGLYHQEIPCNLMFVKQKLLIQVLLLGSLTDGWNRKLLLIIVQNR